MKKGFFVLFGLLIGMLVMGPIASHGQMTQPDPQQSERDLNQQQPSSDLEFEEGRGAAPGGGSGSGVILSEGRLSGEVVNINPQTGMIEIQTEEGVTNRFTVEEEAKEQLNQIKKGDQVDLVMVLRATPQQGTQGGSPQQPMTR